MSMFIYQQLAFWLYGSSASTLFVWQHWYDPHRSGTRLPRVNGEHQLYVTVDAQRKMWHLQSGQ